MKKQARAAAYELISKRVKEWCDQSNASFIQVYPWHLTVTNGIKSVDLYPKSNKIMYHGSNTWTSWNGDIIDWLEANLYKQP